MTEPSFNGPAGAPERAERDRLVCEHTGLVRAIAVGLVDKLPYDLDELVSVGNLALLSAAAAFRPGQFPGVPFGAYARFRIRGAMLETARRRQLVEHVRPGLDEAAEPWTAPARELELHEHREHAKLHEAIRRLVGRKRRVVELHYAGESFASIARRLGCSASWVKQLHAAALVDLREQYGIGKTPAAGGEELETAA